MNLIESRKHIHALAKENQGLSKLVVLYFPANGTPLHIGLTDHLGFDSSCLKDRLPSLQALLLTHNLPILKKISLVGFRNFEAIASYFVAIHN
jgi:hypothetical protein